MRPQKKGKRTVCLLEEEKLPFVPGDKHPRFLMNIRDFEALQRRRSFSYLSAYALKRIPKVWLLELLFGNHIVGIILPLGGIGRIDSHNEREFLLGTLDTKIQENYDKVQHLLQELKAAWQRLVQSSEEAYAVIPRL